MTLRVEPRDNLGNIEVKDMLKRFNFFDSSWNEKGKGILHQYDLKQIGEDKIVLDHATGLTWQQSGSPHCITFAVAEKYVREINGKRFASFNDWRLPTLEEAMSIMECDIKNVDLYISPVFDSKQIWIWTADKKAPGAAWVVGFYSGGCDHSAVGSFVYVRLVRGGTNEPNK